MNKNYNNINDMVSQYETDIRIKGALGTLATGRDSILAIWAQGLVCRRPEFLAALPCGVRTRL